MLDKTVHIERSKPMEDKNHIIKKIPPNIFPSKYETEIDGDVFEVHRHFSGDKSITQALEQYIVNKAKIEKETENEN